MKIMSYIYIPTIFSYTDDPATDRSHLSLLFLVNLVCIQYQTYFNYISSFSQLLRSPTLPFHELLGLFAILF